MARKLFLFLICAGLLSSCSYFNIGNNPSNDAYSRCKEIKRQIVYNSSNNNQMVVAQNKALLDNLNRDYRANDCK